MNRPNILWICTDQQRSDSLGCAGNSIVQPPNIDSIAENGTRFTRHITPMQMCSPSRASMATGLLQRNHQLVTNGRALSETIPTVMSLLAADGYRTHGVGKQHLQPLLAPAEHNMPDSRAFWQTPESRSWRGPYYGFQLIDLLLGESDTAQIAGHYANWLRNNHPDAVDLLKPEHAQLPPNQELDEIWVSGMPAELHYNSWITNCAADFISGASQDESPFFMFVSYPDPHHPFDPPEPYDKRYDPADMPLPQITKADLASRPPYCETLFPKDRDFTELYWSADTGIEAGVLYTTEHLNPETLQTAIAYTYSQIEMIDDGIGKILQTLHDKGLAENTIIIFTSDHGDYLGDHGLLHKGPASYRGITEIPLLMSGPTIKKGQTVSGLTSNVDLAPTLLSLCGVTHDPVSFDGVSLTPMLSGERPTVRSHTFGEYHPTSLKHLYNQTIYTDRWRYTIYPQMAEWGELFDLENDPAEQHNLFFSADSQPIRAELNHLLATEFPPQPEAGSLVISRW